MSETLREGVPTKVCPYDVGTDPSRHGPHAWGDGDRGTTHCPGYTAPEIDLRGFTASVIHLLPGADPEDVRRAVEYARDDLNRAVRPLLAATALTPDEVGCPGCGDALHDGPDYCYGCAWSRGGAAS